MNGNSDATVADPTSIGSSRRRLASEYVQYTSATQITTRKKTSRLTARLRPSFSMPKRASVIAFVCAWKSLREQGTRAGGGHPGKAGLPENPFEELPARA